MSLRFNQVFVGLLALAFVSAFILPTRFTNPLRSISGLFYPVSRPARAIGYAFHRRFERPPKDDRATADVLAENAQLRQLNSALILQLEQLHQINEDRKLIGDVRKLCMPAKVVGNDPGGQRQALNLRIGTLENVRDGMPVLYKHGLVGRIDHAGPAGSQVELITDRDFRIAADFRRYTKDANGNYVYVRVGKTRPFLRGAGRGVMTIQNVELKETTEPFENHVKVGDMVVAADPDWEETAGQWLGMVEKIEPLNAARLVANITVRPIANLATLEEVMVMNKSATGDALQASEKSAKAE